MTSTKWNDTRLKNLFTSVRNGTWGDDPDGQSDVFCARGTDFNRTTSRISFAKMPRRSVAPAARRDHQLSRGDLVIEKSGGSADQPVGSVAQFDLDVPTVCSNFNARMQISSSVDSRFACYLLNGFYWSGFTRQFIKQTTGIQNLDAEALLAEHCIIPPLDEQRRIADFLDAETSRIDRLTDLQTVIIDKMNERETAQLDLAIDRAISDAGVAPLRRFVWGVDQGTSPQCEAFPASDGEWGVLKVGCLRPGIFFPEENKRLPDGVEPKRSAEVREGNLLIARANTPQLVGSTAVVPRVRRKLLLPDKIFRVSLTSDTDAEFIASVARGSRIRALCAASSNGASQSMANIRFEEVKNWPIPAIEITEQREFVARIARGRQELDVLRPAVQRQLDLLAERRQTLITAAVTGQFDVTTASRSTTPGGIA